MTRLQLTSSVVRETLIIGTARYAGDVADEHDDDTDFRQSVPGLRESLIEADAEYAVGPTISEHKVHAANGVSPR